MHDVWQSVPLAPSDTMMHLNAKFKADSFAQKIVVGMGVYRDDNSKPWVLPVVKKATSILLNDPTLDHEYSPILGVPEFVQSAAKLILGPDSPALAQGRVSSMQTISGTGANHSGATFLSKFYDWNGEPVVHLSNPTWINHPPIFKLVGIESTNYPYYDPMTIGLDLEGLLSSLRNAPERSVFLLHACAHNPTGIDPTPEQWEIIADVMLAKKHFAFFDSAYQGFATGDLDRDAASIRYFVTREVPLLICQSFSKNAGLYGERVGALHVVSSSREEATRVTSQLSLQQRSEISDPPLFGARIMALILNDVELFEEWKRDIKTMANRLINIRQELFDILTKDLHTPGNWDHILNQIGMFTFTGLNPGQCEALIEKAHVYLPTSGRISMAGLNSKNVRYFAESVDKAVRGTIYAGAEVVEAVDVQEIVGVKAGAQTMHHL